MVLADADRHAPKSQVVSLSREENQANSITGEGLLGDVVGYLLTRLSVSYNGSASSDATPWDGQSVCRNPHPLFSNI